MRDIVQRLLAVEVNIAPPPGQKTIFEEAAHEIVTLRTALEKLAILGENGMKPDYTEWLSFHDKVAEIARGALKR